MSTGAKTIEAKKGQILYSVLLEFKTRGDLLRQIACANAQLDSVGRIVVQVDKNTWKKLKEYKS